MRPPKTYLIVEASADGAGIEFHPMKKWCRAHRDQSPPEMDPDFTNSQMLRRGFQRMGWSVQETETEVRITPPASAQAVDEVLGGVAGDDSSSDDEAGELGETVFELERQLQEFIAHNIESIRVGTARLRLYTEGGGDGLEYPTAVGPIDILAVDQDGGYVVFELKRGRAPDKAIGQLARYMGWVKTHLANGRPVHGVIVAHRISDNLRYAIAAFQDVWLFEYRVKFELSEIGCAVGT